MRSLLYLNKYFYKYRLRLIAGMLFVLLTNFFNVYYPQQVGIAIDKILNLAQESKSEEMARTALFYLGIILLLNLLKGFFLFLMRQTIIVISRYIEYDLKNEIYHQYQLLSTNFYRKNNTGDLVNRISEDVSRVRMYLGPAIMYSLNMVIMFAFIIYNMLKINSTLAVYVLAPLPILSVIIYLVSDKMNKQSEQVQSQLSSLSTFVQETFSGIRVIKNYVREDKVSSMFTKQSENYKTTSMKLVSINAWFFPMMLLLVGLSTILTIYIGGNEVIAGKLTNGSIATFIIYINMLTWPVASLGWVTSLVQRAAASQKRLNEFLSQKTEIKDGNISITAIEHICFKNVSFKYHNSEVWILKNVSFEINKGESIAITGKTGSGKSTIAALLTRTYDVDEGEILINNINIKSLNISSFRNLLGYVPQDVFLFSDTIANNISFGLHKVSTESIQQAAMNASIHNNIIQFKNGYNTMLGERGITLSGGQKQRVSIARALIKQPNLLLLDDCLSAVDTATEESILNNLKSLQENKITITISHRISSLRNANKILVLDQQHIIEQGNHFQLLELKTHYHQLYLEQLITENAV
ncbi:MAG: hypothetical protein RIQ89_828 [Bacteroidota bacterium]